MMTFTFIYTGGVSWDWGEKWKFPFRVGDVVKVNNWGQQYTTYVDAFKYFGVAENRENQVHSHEELKQDTCKEFKIKGFARHSNFGGLVCHIVNRNNRWVVIGPEGLRVVKQYPLRKGETKEIVIKKIPIM